MKIEKRACFYQLGKNESSSDTQTLKLSGFIESLSKPVKSSSHR